MMLICQVGILTTRPSYYGQDVLTDRPENILRIGPQDLAFFVDECGHEEFADGDYPVFGLGGCAAMGANIELAIRIPWTTMKSECFGDENFPLHASDLTEPTDQQIQGIANFFRTNQFARLASVIKDTSALVGEFSAYQAIALSLQQRFCEIASRTNQIPDKVFFIFEDSERGNNLAQQHFGFPSLYFNSQPVPVEWRFMPKSAGDPGLEVADFIMNAAGGQARINRNGGGRTRRDCAPIFREVPSVLVSYMEIDEFKKADG